MRVRTWATGIITAVGAGGLAIGLAGPALASTHTVQPGDTLSGIAAENGVSLASVEAANPQIRDFNLIYVGDLVNVPDGQSGESAPAPVAPSSPAPSSSAPADSSATSSAGSGTSAAPVSTGGGSSFQQCVAWRESGNNPTASSAGLYGILPSTWASLGLSGTAGSASVAQQNAAFQELYAKYGTSPWAPYDGC
jgi:murein DD-endopeptidase MepM/ murein hydrolase activator NlpD